MQIEVTEKEAMEIHSQRYFKKLGKKAYLPLILLGIGATIGFTLLIISAFTYWWGVIILAILLLPAVYMSLNSSRASGKYAKKQVEEIK